MQLTVNEIVIALAGAAVLIALWSVYLTIQYRKEDRMLRFKRMSQWLEAKWNVKNNGKNNNHKN